jgi:cold shock CspA family protein/ribosome-associated translation inhibitor RaiA
MEVPPEITFRGLEKNDEIQTHILEKAEKLDDIHPGLISCRVAVERQQEHQRSGSPYRVRVVVRIPPGKELVGRREPGEGQIDERLQSAVTDAFEAVQRQLVKIKEKQQGKVKSEAGQKWVGHVVRLFREEGYGFIRSTEGREIFFHESAVADGDYQRLEVGTGVRYFPSEGAEGPQASTVKIVDKPGSRASKVADPRVEPPEGWKP